MHTEFKYLKVLVVDDDEHIGNLLKVVLTAFCVENIHVCTNYDDAVGILEREPITCTFIDYLMEPTNGIKLVEYIRRSEDKALAQLPIILCTVYTDLDKIIEARDAGVSEILAKPLTPMSVFHKIIAAVDKPRPFIDSALYKGPDRRRRSIPWEGKTERRADRRSELENLNVRSV